MHLEAGRWEDLSFLLRDRAGLRELVVTTQLNDFSALNEFSALERLVLYPYADSVGTLDLGCLPNLRELSISGDIPVVLPAGHRLDTFQVERLQEPLAQVVALLTSLRVLRLAAPTRVPSWYPTSLEHLDLSQVRHWGERVGMLHGLASLRELYLTDIRGMTDLRAFAEASSLERLYADDCSELTSMDGLKLASQAQYLFVGRTPLRASIPARWEVPD